MCRARTMLPLNISLLASNNSRSALSVAWLFAYLSQRMSAVMCWRSSSIESFISLSMASKSLPWSFASLFRSFASFRMSSMRLSTSALSTVMPSWTRYCSTSRLSIRKLSSSWRASARFLGSICSRPRCTMSLGDGLAVDRGGHGVRIGSRCGWCGRCGSSGRRAGAAGGVDVCAKSGAAPRTRTVIAKDRRGIPRMTSSPRSVERADSLRRPTGHRRDLTFRAGVYPYRASAARRILRSEIRFNPGCLVCRPCRSVFAAGSLLALARS